MQQGPHDVGSGEAFLGVGATILLLPVSALLISHTATVCGLVHIANILPFEV